MIDQINKLIAINLFLLYVSEQQKLKLVEFKDEQGHQLPGAKMLADIMLQKQLVKVHESEEFTYELTQQGVEISENGGWLTHLEKIKSTNPQSQNKKQNKSQKANKKINIELLIAMFIIAFISFLIVSCI